MPWWSSIVWDVFKFGLERIGFFKPPYDKPEVIIDRIEKDRAEDEDYFIVKNIGNKTALNIELSSVYLNIQDFFNLIFEFTRLDNLDPKQEKRMDCDVYVIENNGEKAGSSSAKKLFFPYFMPEYSTDNFDLLFEYNDSSSKKYITRQSIGKSGIKTKGVYLIRKPIFIDKMFKTQKIIEKRINK